MDYNVNVRLTAMGANILKELGGDRAEQSEFEELILEHFGLASHPSNDEILYSRPETEASLKLVYDRDGFLARAETIADLSADDIGVIRRKVEEQLLTPGPIKVRKRILLTAIPTKGWFRSRDRFQIVPVPADAPRPHFLHADHPLILEFTFYSSPNLVISHQRQERIGREWELVCSALLAWRLWSIGPHPRWNWSIELEGGRSAASKLLREGYTWPSAVLEMEDFSATGEHPVLASVDPRTYYSLHRAGQSLDIPDGFALLVDRFLSLSRRDRERFLRASYWFQHALRVVPQSRSAAFVALISAVEVLSSEPQSRSRCKECGQVIGSGPAKQFADFVEAHLPGTLIPEGERKRFYRLRSAVSHGGKLLLSDHSGWGFTPKNISEDADMQALWQIVRAVLYNWLITKA